MMIRTLSLVILGAVLGCSPGDVLSVPAPIGVVPASTFTNQNGAEQILLNATANLAVGFSAGNGAGVLQWGGLLADEFYWTFDSYGGNDANVDARITVGGGGFSEPGDLSIQALLAARMTLLTDLPLLEQYEPSSGRPKIGMDFALLGYSEILAAEDFCAGLPLATPSPTGVVYGDAITTDSLLGVAEAHFDSAVAYAGSDPIVAPLASVGLGRTRLDRANFVGAASAVAAVPTTFVYTLDLAPGGVGYVSGLLNSANVWDYQVAQGCSEIGTANKKGQNGLNFATANDPRLVFSTGIAETCDGIYVGAADSVWLYPVKFGNPSTAVPLSTGVEARLIEAEAALRAGQVGVWTADLNALRATVPMPALTADSTTTASASMQVDVMFREKAFWLYGTGTRLGDLRRLVRQYGRNQNTVYSVGPYPGAGAKGIPGPLPNYGTDVSLTLPTGAGGLSDPNPNYKGCLNHGA